MLKSILTKAIILEFLTLIAVGVLIYYLYEIRVVENITYLDQRIDLTDNTISRIKAEELSLDSVVRKSDKLADTHQSYFINGGEPNIKTDAENIQYVYKITADQIEKVSELQPNAIPLVFTALNSEPLADQQIIDLIYNAVIADSLTELDIDVTITNKVSNIENIVRELIKKTAAQNVKINVGLPPKWSDVMNYDYLDPISRFYKSGSSISVLNNLSNKIRIHDYGYTTINSSKAGPVTNNSWAENVIQYYIYKGISPSKTTLVINNTAYKWGNRAVTDDYTDNYVLSAMQVEILNSTQLEQLLLDPNLTALSNYQFDDNIAQLNKDGNLNYIVYPKLLSQSYLIELAKSYNLNTIILKNF